ncbi:MAG: redoxin domain-containing protein [bacterium]|nr:redoxin domain-containing protein [bacterium]
MSEGAQAPAFEGRTSTGGTLCLADFRGSRHLVLFFYTKDYTPG